uniref:NDUF8 factor n=1 Tax=Denticeps clupeoides TaxID=299321 RepID=A0AAY3ZV54_9TELE
MSAPNAWSRSRERMRLFPELFSRCAEQAAAYGRCVAAGAPELRREACGREFAALKSCFVAAVMSCSGTRW